MANFKLDDDEVVLLEVNDVDYSGSVGDNLSFDNVILTTKRIVGSNENDSNMIIIPLNKINVFRGNLQVDNYNDAYFEESLRIQSSDGIELFDFDDDELTNTWVQYINWLYRAQRIVDTLTMKQKHAFAEVAKSVREGSEDLSDKSRRILKGLNEEQSMLLDSIINSENNEIITNALEAMLNIEAEAFDNENSNYSYNNESSFVVCSECGSKFSNKSRFCPDCGTAVVKPKIVEVVKCRKCGQKINDNSRFCPDCGTPVIEDKEEKKENKKDKSKNLHKCPACGEFLPSDAIRCPSCGTEIYGREVAISVKEFAKEVSSIEDVNKKIEIIKMYPIPNSKDDITEFMYLASSNIDIKYYATHKEEVSIDTAWLVKIEQSYVKASAMFDAKDLTIIKKLYDDTYGKIKNIKKRKLIFKIVGFALIAIGFPIAGVFASQSTENKTHPGFIVGFIILVIGIVLVVFGFKKSKRTK